MKNGDRNEKERMSSMLVVFAVLAVGIKGKQILLDQYIHCFYLYMGNQSQTSTIVDNQEFSIDHPKIKNAILRKSKNHSYLETTYPIQNTKQYDDWANNLKQNPLANSPWPFHPTKHEYEKSGMCGNSGTATARYDNYPFILSQQIENKQNLDNEKFFADHEVWYLLYILTDMAFKFHRKNEKMGDVRPKNIFVNEDGKVKVGTKYSWPNQISNYEKAFFDKEKTYLSPQEMKQIQIGRAKSTSNPALAEVFSIGLTVLDTILLQNSEHLYKNETFDRSRLDGKRQNLKNEPGYSDLLKYVVLNMTEPNPENRVTSQELWNWFVPFKEKILNLQPFAASDVPSKVDRTAKKNPIIQRNIERSQTQSYNPIQFNHNPIVSLDDRVSVKKVESGVVNNKYEPFQSPINKFTAENSQVRQQPITLKKDPNQDIVIKQQVRHSLDKINQRISNSKKMFPSQ